MKTSPQFTIYLATLLLVLVATFPLAADISATWLGGDGNWTDATQWNSNPNYPNNGGGVTYDATINGGNVTLNQDITIQRLTMSGGSLEATSPFSLTLNEGLTWTDGILGDSLTINLAAGSTSTFFPAAGGPGSVDATINNSGIVNVDDSVNGTNTSFREINNLAGATWTWQAETQPPFNYAGRDSFVNNAGNFVVHGDFFTTVGFNNSGIISANNFGLTTSEGYASGTFNLSGEFFLVDVDCRFNAGTTVNATEVDITAASVLHIVGNSTINSPLSIEGSSRLEIEQGATLTLSGTFSQTPFEDSRVHLKGGTFASAQPLIFHGSLIGSGTVDSNVSNDGTIAPSAPNGGSTGIITITGNLSLLTDSNLVMEIGGLLQGTQYDYLAINGNVGLDGTLELSIINGFESQLDGSQTFTLLTADDISGAFGNVANGQRLVTADGTASFQVNYGPGSLFDPGDLVLSDPQIVPEPASLVLLVTGLALIALVRFRRQHHCG